MLCQWLKQSAYTVVFTGAGMSTESGVPDFRSATGLWKTSNPQKLASTEAMEHNREEFVQFYRKRIEALHSVTPHAGYSILTDWGKTLQLKAIITQNTDGLHELAGNQHVISLHGTIRQLHCQGCKRTYSTEYYINEQLYCQCGGFLRPSVVLFGESLAEQHLEAAEREARNADLFIVLGSSLTVSPANYYPLLAKQQGAKLVIVNYDPTPLDAYADLVVNQQRIGDYLQDIANQLN